ncbi:MAG: trigger factor [Flavobacteriales bacterium]
MNITQEKIDDLNAVLNVEVQLADYQDKVEGALKKHQKTAKMQGFRPGKVPMGLVKKMYEPSVKVDEINRLVSQSLEKYIVDNKLEIIGQPLPKEDAGHTYDWEKQNDFKFTYELGISPKFDLPLSTKVTFSQYKVNIDDQMTDKFIKDISKRYGKMTAPETASAEDLLYVDISELDANGTEKEGGIHKMSVLPLEDINKKAVALFIGKKKDDELTFDPSTLYDDKAKVAALLGVKKDADLGKSFKMKIVNISKMEPAELNQELFDKVYGTGVVTSVEQLREKVKEETSAMMDEQELAKLKNDVINYLLENVSLQLPDEFLKRWLVAVSQKPTTLEQIEKEYDHYKKGVKWQLIENKIIRENDLKVEFAELQEKTKELVRANFKQYGQQIDDEQLASVVVNVLQKEEERRNIYDMLYSDKIVNVVKSKCKVEEKSISYDDFIKLVSEQNN